jgi:hypothetical protein
MPAQLPMVLLMPWTSPGDVLRQYCTQAAGTPSVTTDAAGHRHDQRPRAVAFVAERMDHERREKIRRRQRGDDQDSVTADIRSIGDPCGNEVKNGVITLITGSSSSRFQSERAVTRRTRSTRLM